ncbi:MAG: HupE/UreJ family protein, partial [Novosphingobium sp.]
MGRRYRLQAALLTLSLAFYSVAALAHDVSVGDKAFVQSINGPAFIPFLYLGAKHMVTGYDHILFLIGVV